MSRPMFNSEMVLYLFSSRHIYRAEYFCHRDGRVREIHLMKLMMFLWDPTPKPHQSHTKNFLLLQCSSSLISGIIFQGYLFFLSKPYLPQGKTLVFVLAYKTAGMPMVQQKYLCTKRVPKDDLGYIVPLL